MMNETRKSPRGTRWTMIQHPSIRPLTRAWSVDGILVLSTLDVIELPDGSGNGPTWYVSISAGSGKRATQAQVDRALRDFDMVGAEEDNHHPGAARHFFMPVDPSKRRDCQCKLDETIVVEPSGYAWTNPKEGACRGCEFSAEMVVRGLPSRPCPIHEEARP